ncbi:MAG: POTRA domain-containing protein [Candidatus Neomarinimicrobiota bacterium]
MKDLRKILVLLFVFGIAYAGTDIYEGKKISKIHIEGNERYSSSYLKKQIDIKSALFSKAMSNINDAFIKDQADKIEKYYKSEGFIKCTVRDSLAKVSEDHFHLYFLIEENERYYIGQSSYDLRLRSVDIEGNKTFNDRQLKRYIQIKPVLSRRAMGRVNRRYIKSQAKNLKNYYVSEGFLNCQVRDSLVISENKKLHLFFKVKEKERYYVKQIRVEGNTLLSDAEILNILGLKVREPFRQFIYYNNFKKILARYSELGHPYAEIREEYEWGTDLEIKIIIDEDVKYSVKNISLEGNKEVHEPFIRKHFEIAESKAFDQEDIRRTQDRIYEMGAFSSVNIVPVNRDTSKQELDLKVSVIESKPRRFDIKFGGRQGYTDKMSYSSLFLEPEWTHKNLFHRAHRLKASASYDAIFHNYSLDHKVYSEMAYTVPWLYFLRLPTTFKLYYDRDTYDPFEETESTVIDTLEKGEIRTDYGIDLSSIWRYNRNTYTRFSLSLRNVRSELNNIASKFEPQVEIGLQSRIDNRDSFIYPTKGWNILAYAGYVLGTETRYFRLESSVNTYFPITRRTVLASRLELGQFFDRDSIAAQDLYQLGSETTVRAWSKSIGNDYELASGDTIKAGKAKVLANIELRQDLFWNFGVDVFIDAGRLNDDMSGIFNWSSYFVNTGFGIYYRTPIGPIRLELPVIINDPRPGYDQLKISSICFGVLFAF